MLLLPPNEIDDDERAGLRGHDGLQGRGHLLLEKRKQKSVSRERDVTISSLKCFTANVRAGYKVLGEEENVRELTLEASLYGIIRNTRAIV